MDPTTIDITLSGNGWSWIGYPAQATNSLDAAFAGAEPQEGDLVKSQSAFSLYNDGEWVGTLNAMVPGMGYMYQSTASASKTFQFPKPAVTGRRAQRAAESSVLPLCFESNMTMVAMVKNGDEVVENAQISVYAGTELRGLSTKSVIDDAHFLTIGGSNGEAGVLSYVVQTEDGEYLLTQTDVFTADVTKGSLAEPYVLQLADAEPTDIAGLNANSIKRIELYNGNGHLVRVFDHPGRLLTKSDMKSLPAGVYLQKIVYDNRQTRVEKLLR